MRLAGRLLLLAALFVTWATLAVAQGNYRAQLRGVVTDAAGAVVPNATVTIKNIGTNISSLHIPTIRDPIFYGLGPSTYDVKAEATGFRSAEKNRGGSGGRSGIVAEFQAGHRSQFGHDSCHEHAAAA